MPWGSLGTAYGTAEAVPGYLRDVAFAEPEAAVQANTELFELIWHQGPVYEATVCVVPFLVEIATARGEVSDRMRVWVIGTLVSIAHRPFVGQERERWLEGFSEADRARREAAYADDEAAQAAVAARLPALLSLLDEETPAVQAAIAGLAAQFPEEASPAAGRMGQLRSAAPPGPAADLFRLVHAVLSKQVTPDLLDEVAASHGDLDSYLGDARRFKRSLEGQAAVVADELWASAADQLGW